MSKPGDAAAPVLSASGAVEPPRCSIERIGLQVIVRGTTEAAVCDAIANLMTGGAKVLAPPECSRGEWSAVLDAPR